MIDIQYYVNKYLQEKDALAYLEYYGHYKFDSLYHFKKACENANPSKFPKKLQEASKHIQNKVLAISHFLAGRLSNEEIPVEQKFDEINERLEDNIDRLFPNLEFVGINKPCYCPSCGQKRAYVSEHMFLSCNRKNNCGFGESLTKLYFNENKGTNLDSLGLEVGIDFKANEVHKAGTHIVENANPFEKEDREFEAIKRKEKREKEKEIKYLSFDKDKAYKELSFSQLNKLIENIDKTSEQNKLLVIYEFFFRVIVRDKNKKGELRREPMWNYLLNKRGFDKENKNFKDIGFLHVDEAPLLFAQLLKMFSLEDLILVNMLKTSEYPRFMSRKLQDEALNIVSRKYDSSLLAKEGILTDLDDDKPYSFNYKNKEAALKLLNLISNDDVKNLGFVRFNNEYYTFSFSWLFNDFVEDSGLIFLKSKSLYFGMAQEFRIRPTFIKKGMEKFKEVQFGNSDLITSLPFGLNHDAILKKEILFATEGPMDLLALGDEIKFNDNALPVNGFAIPGVNRVVKEQLGLFRENTVIIIFDADEAGLNGAKKFKEETDKAGVKSSMIARWNPYFPCENGRELLYLKALKNSLLKSTQNNFEWTKPIKDINDIKIAINKNDGSVPFKSMAEFFNKYIYFI